MDRTIFQNGSKRGLSKITSCTLPRRNAPRGHGLARTSQYGVGWLGKDIAERLPKGNRQRDSGESQFVGTRTTSSFTALQRIPGTRSPTPGGTFPSRTRVKAFNRKNLHYPYCGRFRFSDKISAIQNEKASKLLFKPAQKNVNTLLEKSGRSSRRTKRCLRDVVPLLNPVIRGWAHIITTFSAQLFHE